MYVSKVIIQGFRSLKSVEINFYPGINVLVGKNNAGKTNIIQALDLVLGERWPTYANIQEKDFYRSDNLTTNSFLVAVQLSGSVSKECLKDKDVSCRCNEAEQPIWLEREKLYKEFDKGRRVGGKELVDIFESAEEIWIYLLVPKSLSKKERKFAMYVKHKDKWLHLDRFGEALRNALITTAYVPAFRDPERQLNITSYSWYGKLIRSLYDRKTPEQEDTIQKAREILKKVMDEIFHNATESLRKKLSRAIFYHEISFKAGTFTKDDDYKQITLFVNDGIDAPFYDKGSGIQSALVISLFAYYCEQFHQGSSLLLIEEPEIYLHPQARRALHNQLLEFVGSAEEGERQVILSTHSPEFLKSVPISNVVLVRKPRDCTATEVAQIDVSGEKDGARSRQMLHRNAEILFADHVILVEGGEVHLIPVFADKFFGEKGWLDIHNISVCDVGGKASFKNYVRILNSLGIGWTILTDLDFLRDEISKFDKALGGILELEKIKEFLNKIRKSWEEIKNKLRELKGEDVKNKVFDPSTYGWVELYNEVDRAITDLTNNTSLKPERIKEIRSLWNVLKSRVADKNYKLLREKCGKEIDYVVEYLAEKGIFVLRYGELEDYFTEEARRLDSSKERRALKLAEKIDDECVSWEDVGNWLVEKEDFVRLLLYIKKLFYSDSEEFLDN